MCLAHPRLWLHSASSGRETPGARAKTAPANEGIRSRRFSSIVGRTRKK